MVCFGDYGGAPTIIPAAKRKEFTPPDESIPRSPGHKQEWVAACTGQKPWDYPGSNFTYAGPMTEVMLLGAMVEKMGDVSGKIECDAAKREVLTAAAKEMTRREPRKGWDL
jgi:hypothetical protein